MNTPTSYPPLIPAIAATDAAAALDFYKEAFGATELYRLIDPESGKLGHAEFTINGQLMMISDEYPAFNRSPATLGGTTARFALMVADTDASFERAIATGATPIRPPGDQFYGHRSACLRDPFGHEWMLQHEIEQVAPDEMQRRWNAVAKSCPE